MCLLLFSRIPLNLLSAAQNAREDVNVASPASITKRSTFRMIPQPSAGCAMHCSPCCCFGVPADKQLLQASNVPSKRNPKMLQDGKKSLPHACIKQLK
jgi:hypothetical protein